MTAAPYNMHVFSHVPENLHNNNNLSDASLIWIKIKVAEWAFLSVENDGLQPALYRIRNKTFSVTNETIFYVGVFFLGAQIYHSINQSERSKIWKKAYVKRRFICNWESFLSHTVLSLLLIAGTGKTFQINLHKLYVMQLAKCISNYGYTYKYQYIGIFEL